MNLLHRYLLWLAVVDVLGAAIMAGLLFAFSNFVMRALTQLPPAFGMEAMQRVNLAIVNPLFLVVFVGTAAVSVLLVLATVAAPANPGYALLLAGAACYLIGVVGVTAAFNIPLNNSLAAAASANAADIWPRYVNQWLPWNHVRTTFASLAVVCLVVGAIKLGHSSVSP